MSRSATPHTFFKDLQQLYKSIETSTDGQAAIVGIDEMTVRGLLRPNSGYNAHAEFIFSIKCNDSYPRCCPKVRFHSPIFHPNIDTVNGCICLSLLSEWQGCHSLLDIVKALLYLIDHPNFSSANNQYSLLNDIKKLPTKTARLLAGLPVNGRRYTPNAAWCEWAHANGCLPTCEEEVEEGAVEAEVEAEAEAEADTEVEAEIEADSGEAMEVMKEKKEGEVTIMEKEEKKEDMKEDLREDMKEEATGGEKKREEKEKEKVIEKEQVEEEGKEEKNRKGEKWVEKWMEKAEEVDDQTKIAWHSGAYTDAADVDDDYCAINDKELETEIFDELSLTASDSIPSFAKIRYENADEESHSSRSRFYYSSNYLTVEGQRIKIWQPSIHRKSDPGSIFYFIEYIVSDEHEGELGALYSTLFTGNVLRDQQIQPESRQTATVCPWQFFEKYPYYYYPNYTPQSSTLCLNILFEECKETKQSLTFDFCPWSLKDGKGTIDLFSGIFFEGERRGKIFDMFEDSDIDGESENGGIGNLFDVVSSNDEGVKPHQEDSVEICPNDMPEWEMESATSEAELSASQEASNYASETHHQSIRPDSSVSSSAYVENADWFHRSLRDCTYCQYYIGDSQAFINEKLDPKWRWIFRQTRWSFRFAPQQRVDLSMTGICIPPWRVSTGRLMSDLCHFCKRNREMKNLVLLDPMALSPLSPLLNLMRHTEEPRSHLTGVLWMTVLDALSPFYRVPIPLTQRQEGTEGVNAQGDNYAYPQPICLRFLAVTTFLTNWVAWLSRIEIYSALGTSRGCSTLISTPVASCLLQPHSLGCGQAPLFDSWPLWMLRRFLTCSLRLSQLRLPFSQSIQQHDHHFRFLLPFSDLDEI